MYLFAVTLGLFEMVFRLNSLPPKKSRQTAKRIDHYRDVERLTGLLLVSLLISTSHLARKLKAEDLVLFLRQFASKTVDDVVESSMSFDHETKLPFDRTIPNNNINSILATYRSLHHKSGLTRTCPFLFY